MKTNVLLRLPLLMLMVMTVSYSHAAFRSADEALAMANARSSIHMKGQSYRPYRLAYVQKQVDKDVPAFYVLQRDSAAGFMLVSAETQSETVLGYSESGAWDIDHAPVHVRYWMDRYAKQITLLAQSEPLHARKMTHTYTPIEPIIGTKWGQNSPFNDLCPQVGSNRTVTGCVATAISQIMFKHQYPTQGIGTYSYTWNSQTVSANFGNTTYDWKNMLKSYTSSATTAQRTAVAMLVHHVGVASDMNYGVNASGANANTAIGGLLRHFGYDFAVRVRMVNYDGADAVQAAIVEDLQKGLPVLFSARTVSNHGHAFVCEGVDEKGYLYINWGWNGWYDGYFALSLLDPEGQGTGGSASNDAYTEEITVFTGIQPNQGGSAVPQITAVAASLYSNERVKKSTYIGFTLNTLTNSGVSNWNTILYMVVSKPSDGTVIGQKTRTISSSELRPGYYYTTSISITNNFSTLAAGKYNIGVYAKDDNGHWYPVQVKGKGELVMPITVSADSIFFAEEEPVPDPEFAHIKLINTYGTNSWSVDLTSPLFWKSSSLGNDKLLRFTLVSGSENGVVGSYYLSADSAVGVITQDALYAYGYSQSCKQYTPSQLQLTITAVQEQLVVDYYCLYNSAVSVGSAVIDSAEQDWWQLYQGENYYHDSPTKELVSPMTVATAQSLGGACTDSTYIPYLIKGIVSSSATFSDGVMSFAISDNGSSASQLAVNQCLWLDKANVTAECGLNIGDTVVVYGKLRNVASQLSCEDGYIYQLAPSSIPTHIATSQEQLLPAKVIVEGQVRIIRNGKTYDLLGKKVEIRNVSKEKM